MRMRGLASVALFAAFLSPLAARAGEYNDGTYKWYYSTYKNEEGRIVAHINDVAYADSRRGEIEGALAVPSAVTQVATLELGYEKWDDDRERYLWTSTRAPKVEMQSIPVEMVSDIEWPGITALTIPDSVKYVYDVMNMGWYDDWGCDCCDEDEEQEEYPVKLVTVSLPAGLKDIDNSFNYCSNLVDIAFNGSDFDMSRSFRNTAWSRNQGDFLVLNGSLMAYQGKATSVAVPEGIVEIAANAFDADYNPDCTNLVSVTLPKTLEEIATYAFYGCERLKSIEIPRGVWFIGSRAFEYTGLTAVNLPASLRSLGYGVFDGTPIASLTVPEGLQSLDGVCSGCTNLTSVALPSTTRSLNSAFYGCGKLTSVALPAGVKYMASAFANCTNLTAVALPAGVKNLNWAFQNCYRLKTVDIPASVKSVYYAFYQCTNLVSVTGGAGLQSVYCPFGYPYSHYEWDEKTETYEHFVRTDVPCFDKAPDGFRMLGGVAYGYKGALPKNLAFPAGTRFVESTFFDHTTNAASVASVTFPDSVEVVRASFNNWTYEYHYDEDGWYTGYDYTCKLNAVNLGAGVTNLASCYFPSTVSNVTGGAALRRGASALAGTAWAQKQLKNCGTNAVPFNFVRLGSVALGYVGRVPASLVIPDDLTEVYGGFNYRTDPAVSNVVSVSGGASLWNPPYLGYFDKLATIDMPGTRMQDYYGYGITNLVSVKLGVDPELMAEMTDKDAGRDEYGDEEWDEDEEYGFGVSSDAFEGCDKLASVEFVSPGFKIADWSARFWDDESEDLVFLETFPYDLSTFRYIGYRTQLDEPWGESFYLRANVRRSTSSSSVYAVPFDGAKGVYNGLLYDGAGKFAGTFSASVGKANAKTGLAKATVKLVPISGKKSTIRGDVDANGIGQGGLAGLVFTKNGVSGFAAGFAFDGALDQSKDRTSAVAQALKALKGQAWGVAFDVHDAASDLTDGQFALSILMGANGKAKIAGVLPSGTKVSVNAVSVTTSDRLGIPVVVSRKTDALGFVYWVDLTGKAIAVTDLSHWTGVLNVTKQPFDEEVDVLAFDKVSDVNMPVFTMHASKLPAALANSFTDMLPLNENFTSAGGRWKFEKNATVKYAKGVFDQAAFDKGVAAGKTNASNLKMTFQKRDGSFKGSFKLYSDNGKGGLKKTAVVINGVVIKGAGYGSAFVKKIGSFPVNLGIVVPDDDDED